MDSPWKISCFHFYLGQRVNHMIKHSKRTPSMALSPSFKKNMLDEGKHTSQNCSQGQASPSFETKHRSWSSGMGRRFVTLLVEPQWCWIESPRLWRIPILGARFISQNPIIAIGDWTPTLIKLPLCLRVVPIALHEWFEAHDSSANTICFSGSKTVKMGKTGSTVEDFRWMTSSSPRLLLNRSLHRAICGKGMRTPKRGRPRSDQGHCYLRMKSWRKSGPRCAAAQRKSTSVQASKGRNGELGTPLWMGMDSDGLSSWYIYIYRIPAKPLSRRRQNCHSSRSNFAPRAGETRFFLFLSSKKCIWPAATNEFEHVHFAWQAQCFMTLQNNRIAFSLAGARLFALLARSGWSLFCVFLAGCGAASFIWGGVRKGVGVGA